MRAIGAPIQLPVLASPFHLMNLPSGRGLYGVWISTQFPNPVQSQDYSGAMWACDLTTDLPDFSLFSTLCPLSILNASLYLIPGFLSPLFRSIGDNLFQEVKS